MTKSIGNIETPFNEEFCNQLEFRLSREFSESNDAKLKSFWCDGISWFPTDNQLIKKHVNGRRIIITKAWVGKSGQEVYQTTIHFGKKSLSNYEKGKELTECIPEFDSETDWIEINIEEKKIDIRLK